MNHSGINADRIQQGRAALRAARAQKIKPVPGTGRIETVTPPGGSSRSANDGAGVEVLTALLVPAVSLMATAKPMEKFEFKEKEIILFSRSWAAVIDEYFPDIKGGNLLQACLVTGGIMSTRIHLLIPEKKATEGTDQDNQEQADTGHQEGENELMHWQMKDDNATH